MNLVAVAIFFYKTCRDIFNYLLRQKSSNGGLFGPVSAYFKTVKINSRDMLHLYCLVFHKTMSSFSDLSKRIVDEDGFKIRLLSFLDQVISCEMTPVDTNQVLLKIELSTSTINNASVLPYNFKIMPILSYLKCK